MRKNNVFEIITKNMLKMFKNWRFGIHGGILA
jgi:hypothetical protein